MVVATLKKEPPTRAMKNKPVIILRENLCFPIFLSSFLIKLP
jgi:hypothetical protein